MSSKIGEYIRAHVLGLLAVFIALSGTAVAGQRASCGEGPKASASVVTDAKFKKLKRRVAALKRRPRRRFRRRFRRAAERAVT